MRYAFLVLPLVVACSGAAPSSAEDCAGIGSEKKRDDCYIEVLPAVFAADPAKGVEMVETKIADPVNRDFAWYTVTKRVDPNSNKYCDRIRDTALAARCRDVVARPHLHRDLTGASGPGSRPPPPPGPGGGPPASGATPPPGTPPPGGPAGAVPPPGAAPSGTPTP